ncbi:MAG: hypothetical protein AUK35_05140 [Zetaproteobacteria bacterium CG2_30_46_52]|nr:MAG: hypothetical protein AUK35_05140 [Zetaproteobacteria bacterium CG2_30_46_52]
MGIALRSGSRVTIAMLIGILTMITVIILSITIYSLYQASFETERQRLAETVKSRARFIEAVARFDREYADKQFEGSAEEATLIQIEEAHNNFEGFGETGEYVLAKHIEENIVFLLRHRHDHVTKPKDVLFASNLAEPMRRALLGESGTHVGLDYEGQMVLAAYEPVAEFNMGAVVKIDIAEIRAPFIRAGLIAMGAAILFILIGAFLFARIGMPLIRRVEASEENLKLALESSGVGTWSWNIIEDKHHWDNFIHPLFGLAPGSFSGNIEEFFDLLHPEDRIRTKLAVQKAVEKGSEYNSEYRTIWPNGEVHTLVARGKVYYNKYHQAERMTGVVFDITDRREVESKLEFTQFAIDEAPDMAFWLRSDGSFFYVNDAASQRLGYPKQTLLTMKAFDVNPIHSAKAWGEHWKEVRDKKKFTFEAAILCKSGEIFPAEFSVNYVVVNGQEYNCSFVRDISARKEVEEEIRQVSNLTSTIISSLNVGITIYDESGQCTLANDAMVTLVGAGSKEALLAQNYNTIPTWNSGLLAAAKTSFKNKKPQRQKIEMTTTFGKYAAIDCYFIPFQLNNQPHLLFTAYDITDLRNYEQLMGEYENKLNLLSASVEQTEESIVITDLDGSIIYSNAAFAALTGYEAEEAVGRNPRILKSGRQSAAFYRQMWSTLATGDSWQGRMVNKRKDGSLYPALLTVSPIKNDEGVVTNYVGIQQNLSVIESLEEQLHQAQKMEALGTLVGGIAHEFNNSLAAVTGNLYLAKKEAAILPSVVDKIETVERLSFASAELIKSLLSFARKGIVDKATISLAPFLKESIKLQRISLPENIALNIEVIDDDVLIEADANLLQQLLMNLINNSRDAVQDVSQPTITITIRKFEADAEFFERHPECHAKAYAKICVGDNGVGISAEHLPHMFEPFHTTKSVGQGTGLGLAMAYGTVQSHHGGAIEIESVEGIGTKVKIYLPIFYAEEAQTIEGLIEIDVVSGKGETILLVDDNESLLTTGRAILESLSYKVLTASNGQEAIAVYQANKDTVALILTDVVMPVMGGVDAVKKIRESAPDVKVIFTTGYDRNHMRKADHMDDEDMISKPFKLDELSLLLRAKLER